MSFLVLMPRRCERFESLDERPHVVYEVYGGAHPTVFKTIRNAVRTASTYGNSAAKRPERKLLPFPGLVVKFDPGYLPIVLDPATAAKPMPLNSPDAVKLKPAYARGHCTLPGPEKFDEEYALAERQMLLWQERVLYLKQQLSITE